MIKFTSEHGWISFDGQVGIVGITDYCQEILAELVYVELPDVGSVLEKGADAVSVESVMTTIVMHAPVSGEVIEVNSELVNTPDLVNKSPEEKGWMYKLRLSDPSQLDALMDKAAYAASLR